MPSQQSVEAEVDLRVYRLVAIKKAAYRVARLMTVVIVPRGEHVALLQCQFPSGVDGTAAQERMRRFYEELLDQELREQVALRFLRGGPTRPACCAAHGGHRRGKLAVLSLKLGSFLRAVGDDDRRGEFVQMPL